MDSTTRVKNIPDLYNSDNDAGQGDQFDTCIIVSIASLKFNSFAFLCCVNHKNCCSISLTGHTRRQCSR